MTDAKYQCDRRRSNENELQKQPELTVPVSSRLLVAVQKVFNFDYITYKLLLGVRVQVHHAVAE